MTYILTLINESITLDIVIDEIQLCFFIIFFFQIKKNVGPEYFSNISYGSITQYEKQGFF